MAGFLSFADKRNVQEAIRQKNGYIIGNIALPVQLKANHSSEESKPGLSERITELSNKPTLPDLI